MTHNWKGLGGRWGSLAVRGLVALFATLCAHLTVVQATTIDTCLSHKLGYVGKSVASRTRCRSRDAARPDPAMLAACLGRTGQRFIGTSAPTGQFEKLERILQCLTTGDQVALDAAIAAYVTELGVQIANPGTPSKCDAAKLTCVGRYVAGVLACNARAAAGTGIVDDLCVMKQTMRLSDGARGCIERAEVPDRMCSVTGDVAALEDAADAFIKETLCALDPAGTADCAGTPTATPKIATPSPLLPTASRTPAATATALRTPAATATPLPNPTRTATAVPSRTPTPTASATRTRTPTPTRTPTATASPDPNDPAQICVDEINRHRASVGLGPLARWTAGETCVDGESLQDSQTGTPHSAFGHCSELAQNECPGWPGPSAQMIPSCLQAMWNEGPGQDFTTHGHYINMTNPSYSKVACGFAVKTNGTVWAAQDFQ